MLIDAYGNPIGIGLFYIAQGQNNKPELFYTHGVKNSKGFLIERSDGTQLQLTSEMAQAWHRLSDSALETAIAHVIDPDHIPWIRKHLP